MIKSRSIVLPALILSMGILGCAGTRQQAVQEKPANISMEKPMQYRWISAKGGLSVRNKPDAAGEKIGAIPFGTEVLVISEAEKVVEMSGRKGRWTKISWYGPEGWVFGAFLSAEEVKQEEKQARE